MTQTIVVATLVGRLSAGGADRAKRKPIQHWAGYDFFLRGRERVNRYDVDAGESLLRQAIEQDPDFAPSYVMLSRLYLFRFFSDARAEMLSDALAYAKKAISLDENDAQCRMASSSAN